MFRNIRIGTKILFMVLFVSLFTLLLITVISYTQMLNLTKYSQNANVELGHTASEKSKKALTDQAEEYLTNIAQKQAEGSNAVFHQIDVELTTMSDYMEWLYANPSGFTGRRVPFITDAPNAIPSAKYMYAPGTTQSPALERELRLISNAEYAFSGMLRNETLMRNIYLGTESGISYRYSRSNSHNPSYDPREQSWYKSAMENRGETIWVDTYVDPFGKVTVTCARAFKNSAGEYTGVTATDIVVDEIVKSILDLRIGTKGYAFLLDTDGAYIAHPRYGEEGFNTNPMENAQGEWRKVLENMAAGEDVEDIIELDGQEYYLVSEHLPETAWILCVIVPIAEVIAEAEKTEAEIVVITDEAQIYIRKTLSGVLIRFIVIFAVLAIMVVTFSYLLSANITQPIEDLTATVKQISQGVLDSTVTVRGKDEIAELGTAFNRMTVDLKEHIRNIAQITAEKERINGELTAAADIQNNMLPRMFPAFTGHPQFFLYGKMEAAKQVGGDFFDFFYLNEEKTKVALVIADVSGKGIPAALFMVIAKTLIKTHLIKNAAGPAEALTQVNALLCEDNNLSMFVTVFAGIADLNTGLLTFVNAGHNPPLISRRGGDYEFLKEKGGMALGVMEDAPYRSTEIALEEGDRLCLYTDGVNEAENPDGQQFGNKRLLAVANNNRLLLPEEFDGALRQTLSQFVNGAEQSDDITTLSFLYTRKAP